MGSNTNTGGNGEAAPLLLDAKRAATMLGICKATLWRWRRAGVMPPPVIVHGLTRWRARDLEAWVAAGCVPLDSVRVSG